MHPEILTKEQNELLPLMKSFFREYCLVGGTAIALHLGHRESIDFDLFKNGKNDILKIRNVLSAKFPIQTIKFENANEFTLKIKNVQLTFFNYPFKFECSDTFLQIFRLPSLLTLASLKAYALGQRAKWKDYIDLYYIFKNLTFREVADNTKKLFGAEFNEKLFRQQLCYFEDVSFLENISFKSGFEVEEAEVKATLTKISIS